MWLLTDMTKVSHQKFRHINGTISQPFWQLWEPPKAFLDKLVFCLNQPKLIWSTKNPDWYSNFSKQMLQSLAKSLYLIKYEDLHQSPGLVHTMYPQACHWTWMSIFYIYKIAETISISSTFVKQVNAFSTMWSNVK